MCSLSFLHQAHRIQDAKVPSPGSPAPETSPFPCLWLWSPCLGWDPLISAPAGTIPLLSILLSYFHRLILGYCYDLHTLC